MSWYKTNEVGDIFNRDAETPPVLGRSLALSSAAMSSGPVAVH